MHKGKGLLEEVESKIYLVYGLRGSDELNHFRYTGIVFNYLAGFFYIINKYPGACYPGKVYLNRQLTDQDYFIVWSCDFNKGKRKLDIPPDFVEEFKNCLNKSDVRFIVTLLGFDNEKPCTDVPGMDAHLGLLIYDRKTNCMERIDPNYFPFIFDAPLFDETFGKFMDRNLGVKYIGAINTTLGKPQLLEDMIKESPVASSSLDSQAGYCTVWSLWTLAMKLANPDVPIQDLIIIGTSRIERKQSLRKFIENYAEYIMRIGDNVIEKLPERLRGKLEYFLTTRSLTINLTKDEIADLNKAMLEELKNIPKHIVIKKDNYKYGK